MLAEDDEPSDRNWMRMVRRVVRNAKVKLVLMRRMVSAVHAAAPPDHFTKGIDVTSIVIAEFGKDRLPMEVLLALEARMIALSGEILPYSHGRVVNTELQLVFAAASARLEIPPTGLPRFDRKSLGFWYEYYGAFVRQALARLDAEKTAKEAIWA